MADVIIENPILNSPFREPTQHFRFIGEGRTGETAEGRRSRPCFIPIAEASHNIGVSHRQRSTLANDVFRSHEFNFMLSNPLLLLGEQP